MKYLWNFSETITFIIEYFLRILYSMIYEYVIYEYENTEVSATHFKIVREIIHWKIHKNIAERQSITSYFEIICNSRSIKFLRVNLVN